MEVNETKQNMSSEPNSLQEEILRLENELKRFERIYYNNYEFEYDNYRKDMHALGLRIYAFFSIALLFIICISIGIKFYEVFIISVLLLIISIRMMTFHFIRSRHKKVKIIKKK